MKENNGVFLVTFIVMILLIVLFILGIKYLNLGVKDDVIPKYGIVAKNVIETDDLDIWNRKDNLFVSYNGNLCGVVDINSKVVVDIEYDKCKITSNGFIVNKEDNYYLLNRDGEIVLETEYEIFNKYDSYSETDYYVVNTDGERKIYNIEAKNLYNVLNKKDFYVYGDFIVFKDTVTNYVSGDTFKIDNYYGSGKYLVFDLYKSNGYKVYDFVNKKETKYSTLVENDYSLSFSNDSESLIIDYNGNVLKDGNVRKVNENYSLDYGVCEYGFKVKNKDKKYINDTCYSNINEDALKYGYLYLYDDIEEEWTAIYSDKSLNFYDEEVIGEFIVSYDAEINDYVYYDRNGSKKDFVCINSFYELDKDKYVCADLFYYYIVDKDMNKLTSTYDSIYCNDNDACVFRDNNGKYGLMINETIVIEPTYYSGYIDENYVFFEVVGGYEIFTLGNIEKELTTEELKYEFKINYGELSTEEVIKEYSLNEIEDIIYDNEELFKEYAYVVLTNDRVNGYRREILLMFDVVVDNKEHLNKEYFLLSLDKLQIKKTDTLEGTSYSGYYDDYEKKIELLIDDLNVINHELMHFVESNLNYSINSLMYQCNDEYYYLIDMKEFDEEKLSTCNLEFFDYGNFIEEVGAEVNSARYSHSKIIAYSDASVIYHGLVYLYGEEFMKDVYFAQDGEMQLYRKLTKSLTHEEYVKFIKSVVAITNSNIESYDDYATVFNTFDKLYSEVIGGNWYEDNEFKYIMSVIYDQGDIVVDNEDKNHLVDVDALLKDIALSIDEKYVVATSNVGIYMLDDKTYLDISVWNEDELVDLRINYDFENLTVLNSEAI